jgi:hypothetical protein
MKVKSPGGLWLFPMGRSPAALLTWSHSNPDSMSAPPDLKRLSLGERLQDPLLVLGIDQRDASRGPSPS